MPASISNGALDLSVIIVSWNTASELRDCILSAISAGGSNVEIIVVDNASSDGSAEMVACEFPDVKLIVNKSNRGFAKASNQGIRVSGGRYILLLNPDSIVRPGAFDALIRFGDDNPDAGIFGLKVLNTDGSIQYSCRQFPTLAAGIFRNTILRHFFPKNPYVRDYLLAEWDHSEQRDVDWVSGAALVARRELIEDIGLLDERFFMYCEDVDLGYRAKEKGWRVSYFPGAVVVHACAKSSDQTPDRMIIEHHKSMYRFFLKHYRKDASIAKRIIVPLGLIARASGFVGRNYFYRLKRYIGKRRNAHG